MTDRSTDRFAVSVKKSTTTRPKTSTSAATNLKLCYRSAYFQRRLDDTGIITRSPSRVRSAAAIKTTTYREDGFYSVTDSPLTNRVVKPYPMYERRMSLRETTEDGTCATDRRRCRYGRLLEIAVREVIIRQPIDDQLQINGVTLLYRGKSICRTNRPFNRKLHKLFVRSALDSSNFSMQVHAPNDLSSSLLPLPLPPERRPYGNNSVKRHRRMDIDFSIADTTGRLHSGVVVCSVSLSVTLTDDNKRIEPPSTYLYSPTTASDPNDPRNSYSLTQLRRDRRRSTRQTRYFLLHDPALCLAALPPSLPNERQEALKKRLAGKQPDIVVAEQMFSLLDISVRSWFQERRPLRPSSALLGPASLSHRGNVAATVPGLGGRSRQVFTVTILRGVEVPLREESAQVQPIVEIEWADMTRCTESSDGPAPVWQQTLRFEIPTSKMSYEHCVQLRLFDQHPIWGLQWLGEARVPLECNSQAGSQQFERWIGLSTLYSPCVSFGYVPASPASNNASNDHWHTRVYVLMKLEQMTSALGPNDAATIDNLCKAVQRCLVVPYRLAEIVEPNDAGRLVMLLAPLPVHYGPLTPRQALNLNKVDHYGRSALLAALLQGLGLQAYVLLGSSQTRKWASFVLTLGENTDNNAVTLWDAENGEHYELQDNRCSLISVSRLINHHNIWDNAQKSLAPANMRYDPKIGKDWQLRFSKVPAGGARSVQAVELGPASDTNTNNDDGNDDDERTKIELAEVTDEIEESLKRNLTRWRTSLELTTIFNRHAETVVRDALIKSEDNNGRLDRKDVRQLYRAYYIHGYVVKVRYTDIDDLAAFLLTTKVHAMTGPIEFGLVGRVQKLVGKIRSVTIAVVVIRNR